MRFSLDGNYSVLDINESTIVANLAFGGAKWSLATEESEKCRKVEGPKRLSQCLENHCHNCHNATLSVDMEGCSKSVK